MLNYGVIDYLRYIHYIIIHCMCVSMFLPDCSEFLLTIFADNIWGSTPDDSTTHLHSLSITPHHHLCVMCSGCARAGECVWYLYVKRVCNVCLLFFHAIATIFHLYHGSDMLYEMRRRKPEPILLLTQGIFNLPHHTGVRRTGLLWHCKLYADGERDCCTVNCYGSDGICTPDPRVINREP